MAEFVHLHNHTEYSLLDGMLRVSEDHKPSQFLKNLAQQGIPAMAMTDHGNMYGALDFYAQAKAVNVKPLIGCEFYITEGDHKVRSGRTGHLTLLARDYAGYRNLMKLNSKAWVEGFYYYPRIDKELLLEFHEGLLCLSGCLKGFVSQYVREPGNFDKACAYAKEFEDIFGKGNYYIELMDHGIREELEALPLLKQLSARTGIPMVATNDCHFEKKTDHEAHEIQVCNATKTTLSNEKRMRMSKELYFKSPEEMCTLFAHTPEACQNTLAIAEKCNVLLPEKPPFVLPYFEIPPQYPDSKAYFKDLCRKGLTKKMNGNVPDNYWKQLEFEFDVIITMGFDCYFLIVQDFINWARAHGVPIGPGRGSGAGSLVAYSLDITRIDPIKNKLLFERFLNPDRISMPDLDIDIADEGRERVIDYVRGKYGADKVSQIITFGTLKAKQALKDVARVMDVPVADANRLAKMIPNDPKITLEQALESNELKQELEHNPQSKKVFEMARKIEGLKRHTGIHAAGVLITKEAVSEYVPLALGKDDIITTQFEGEPCSNLGLLKMDFLGLSTLTVIDNAEKMVRQRHKPDFDITQIPLDDKKTYDMLCQCHTLGVFQLESGGMRDLVKKIQPTQFADLSALVALFRPGPMESGMMDMFVRRKNGQEKIEYETPLMEEPLKDTYGCMIYQEQIMQLSKLLGGFTPGEADSLRKAMGKKKLEVMEKFGKKFVEGCAAHKIPEKTAQHIYEQMKAFAGYGFNKSHSYAYALVAYQTAYLKANYPIEFMCAALTNEIGNNAIGSMDKENKIVTYLAEARRMGFDILPPDVNHSEPEFSVEEKDGKQYIRYALEAIKNAGTEGCLSIVNERKANGPYTSLDNLCSRVDLFQVNKKALESLIKAGALDSIDTSRHPKQLRAELLAKLEDTLDTAHAIAKDKASGMGSLFGDDTSFMGGKQAHKEVAPFSQKELLNNEKEVLGLFLSGHPMAPYQPFISKMGYTPITDILEERASGRLTVAGTITFLKKKQNKKSKKEWAQMVVEDCSGALPVNVFPKAYERLFDKLAPNAILTFNGMVDHDDESARVELSLQDVGNIIDRLSATAKEFTVRLPADYTQEQLQKLSSALNATRGITQVYLEIPSKQDPSQLHRVRTEKHIQVYKGLLDLIEDTWGNAWSIK